MKVNKTRTLVLSLILVIVVLLGFIIYAFVIKPSFTGYAVKLQNQGYAFAIASIMQQAVSSCQPVPLTFGNQTINIIAVECLQQTTG